MSEVPSISSKRQVGITITDGLTKDKFPKQLIKDITR